MRQKLGQHFLKNREVLQNIARALKITNGDIIIEIGPGHGELTREILKEMGGKKNAKLIAIEKDKELARDLRLRVGDLGLKNVEIIEGDARKLIPSFILGLESYKLAGNIPYYLTGFLFRIIGELRHKPIKSVFTIQKEVAERIVASPPHMNLLAASVQFWAHPSILAYIPKRDFSPPPKVDSAVIVLETKKQRIRGKDEDYYAFLKKLFTHPRKTIINNLAPQKGIYKEKIAAKLASLEISPGLRPSFLSIQEIQTLSKALKNPTL